MSVQLTRRQFNLGWKIALAVKGRASSALLKSFDNERIPVIAEMLNITTELYKLTFSPDTISAIQSASDISSNDEKESSMNRAFFRGRKLWQLDVNYRWSDIVFDERFENDKHNVAKNAYGSAGQDVRAGDRAPDAPGLSCIRSKTDFQPTRLFDIYSPSKHTAFIFDGRVDKSDSYPLIQATGTLPAETFQKVYIIPSTSNLGVDDAPGNADYVLKDEQGYAFKHFGLSEQGTSVVIVRPDAMVGAFALTEGGVEQYVSAVFND